jgi:hypothetical protein
MNMKSNPQIELAFDYVSLTNKNIFLTGKAGTGKTTFLRRIRQEIPKRMAVVAPTGVAAINAEGVTIHSLFQLPFGPLVPDQVGAQMGKRRFSKQKINLIKSLDLLVIDEISMVRADVLDAIDVVLRRFRNRILPFGGLQLLMIGDLHQLPPVVKNEEWELLRPHYDTPYFFGSQTLQKTGAITIELRHIYRQSDPTFIDILNAVRDNKIDSAVLEKLNSRYLPDFEAEEEEGYITLSSHNASARKINQEKLAALSGKSHVFKARIEGDFPEHAYPTDEKLEFKVDAQVMFVKNDMGDEKRYYNGKIGRITRIHGNLIFVRCPGDDKDILVEGEEWTNRKYTLDTETKEVKEETIGSFLQHPLKLAWAITIHKSQGLTFEKVIIDAQAAFAHGQVYVALSRCKTFEGIVLKTRLFPKSVKTDAVIQNYSEEAKQNEPGEAELDQAKKEYQQELLMNYFEFQSLKRNLNRFRTIVVENERKLPGNIVPETRELIQKAQDEVLAVGETFIRQMKKYFAEASIPEENEPLIDRLKKAGGYFAQKLEKELLPMVNSLEILTDNKDIRTKTKERKLELEKELFIQTAVAKSLMEGFEGYTFAKTPADAEIEYDQKPGKKSKPASRLPSNIEHPALYKAIAEWRMQEAEERGIPPYQILTTKSLIELVAVLPTDKAQLTRIHGIGKARAKEFGDALIGHVKQFAQEFDVETDHLELASKKRKTPKVPKSDTKSVSFEMFRNGKAIPEIAKERGFAITTIENHLAYFVGKGEIEITDLMKPEMIEEIAEYFREKAKSYGLSEAKAHFKDRYSYGQLRLVRAAMGEENF